MPCDIWCDYRPVRPLGCHGLHAIRVHGHPKSPHATRWRARKIAVIPVPVYGISPYRLIGGKVAAESRKRLTFLLFGEVKNETKNGRMVHYIEHRTDKEMKAAKADKKDLMTRIKLLSENFNYVTKTTDKVEAMIKAYEKLSEKDQKAFLRKLYELY